MHICKSKGVPISFSLHRSRDIASFRLVACRRQSCRCKLSGDSLLLKMQPVSIQVYIRKSLSDIFDRILKLFTMPGYHPELKKM